ncbi:hypothetical protein [Herminiimonas aquatilis]|uniref:Uncharacterized protein n=1 Tax=Herminiimonas aquatilis TaxID=345342 RepID=A0ABW2J769_9BURK
MQVAEEFKIQDAKGHVVILQKIRPGISYLDFGMTHLPRSFQGYRVKYTDRTAELRDDGTFQLSDTGTICTRV